MAAACGVPEYRGLWVRTSHCNFAFQMFMIGQESVFALVNIENETFNYQVVKLNQTLSSDHCHLMPPKVIFLRKNHDLMI